ncbi:hypothetical protein N665_0392s0040 [Sinapis alba]|nr:hypothetical protein N665_0392s0040 [Sinapis alba]
MSSVETVVNLSLFRSNNCVLERMVYGSLSLKVLNFELDQLGDVLHWIRQVVGLLCGLVWGSIPLVGGIWLLLLMKKTMGVMQLCSRMVYLLL